jgi:hypothetical protein
MSRVIATGIVALALVYGANVLAEALHTVQHPIKTRHRVLT